MSVFDTNILILCKTYPSPSGKYAETSCVAGMLKNGGLVRLFPVPFRLITKDQQFKKWQWISAKVERARSDHRPESLNIKVDTIGIGGLILSEANWSERRRQISKIKLFDHFDEIEAEQNGSKLSLALLKPGRVLGVDILPVSEPKWTEEELAKLEQQQNQGGLFDKDDKPIIRTLRKLPYDFYYRYQCGSNSILRTIRHKLVDWEVGALFWKCYDRHGDQWELLFRKKLEDNLPKRDLMFLLGNQHRFQDQWMIISLIYPPHVNQGELF